MPLVALRRVGSGSYFIQSAHSGGRKELFTRLIPAPASRGHLCGVKLLTEMRRETLPLFVGLVQDVTCVGEHGKEISQRIGRLKERNEFVHNLSSRENCGAHGLSPDRQKVATRVLLPLL